MKEFFDVFGNKIRSYTGEEWKNSGKHFSPPFVDNRYIDDTDEEK